MPVDNQPESWQWLMLHREDCEGWQPQIWIDPKEIGAFQQERKDGAARIIMRSGHSVVVLETFDEIRHMLGWED